MRKRYTRGDGASKEDEVANVIVIDRFFVIVGAAPVTKQSIVIKIFFKITNKNEISIDYQ